jgi:hypothetical protein
MNGEGTLQDQSLLCSLLSKRAHRADIYTAVQVGPPKNRSFKPLLLNLRPVSTSKIKGLNKTLQR